MALVHHERALSAQTQQVAACNALHELEERLSRWLLQSRDLLQSDTLPLTQEFLAQMLGVQRSSVTGDHGGRPLASFEVGQGTVGRRHQIGQVVGRWCRCHRRWTWWPHQGRAAIFDNMPIRNYLDGERFDPETTRLLGIAFETAIQARRNWGELDPPREAIAKTSSVLRKRADGTLSGCAISL
jgi:hypothetical protein